jgi:hypothetical protein
LLEPPLDFPEVFPDDFLPDFFTLVLRVIFSRRVGSPHFETTSTLVSPTITSFELHRIESTTSRARTRSAKTRKKKGNARITIVHLFTYRSSTAEPVLGIKSYCSPSNDFLQQGSVYSVSRGVVQKATGLTFCFFNSFTVWSDYVQGKMNEKDFLEKAKLEVEKMVGESNLGRG